MIAALVHDLQQQFAGRERVLVGIAGPPGSGKSTLAAALARSLGGAVIALDGFHFTSTELAASGLSERKGSPPTFHVQPLIARLRRLRDGRAVRAPIYSRTLHEPVPDAVRIDAAIRWVIVEGNYLLLDAEPWRGVRALLDTCWYLDVPLDLCLRRVRARHVQGGLSEAAADHKIASNDRPNAEAVIASRDRADRTIEGATL